MSKNFHFISGLPRSGSTLLSAILKQNPKFTASMTGPVATLCGAVQSKMNGGEFGVFFDDAKRRDIMRGIFHSYYAHTPEHGVVFDTNRSWTGRMALLNELFPQSRVICCVRDIGWILDSIERLLNKNPLQLSRMFGFQPGTSVYNRSDMVMSPDKGLIGLALVNMREAWFGEESKRLIIVPYEKLVQDPAQIVGQLYRELGEPSFTHDFDNVVYDEPDYDAHIGMPGLHTVKQRVQPQHRIPCIPPDLFTKHVGAAFWNMPEQNPRRVTIL